MVQTYTTDMSLEHFNKRLISYINEFDTDYQVKDASGNIVNIGLNTRNAMITYINNMDVKGKRIVGADMVEKHGMNNWNYNSMIYDTFNEMSEWKNIEQHIINGEKLNL